MARIICWYSKGIASLIASKLALDNYKEVYPDYDIEVVCIHLENEYDDKDLVSNAEDYLGMDIKFIQDEKYNANVDTVIEKTRYMAGVYGARCTTELKKNVRKNYQKFDDIHVFGMTSEEEKRVDRILDAEPELNIWTPLIDKDITKMECFEIAKNAGLDIPTMYKLGFKNNNCIGCLKAGGAGYWNKIRKHFPEIFDTRAYQEELLNVSLCKMSYNKIQKKHPEVLENMSKAGYEPKIDKAGQMRIPLRFLPEDAGTFKDLDIGDCGFVCESKGD